MEEVIHLQTLANWRKVSDTPRQMRSEGESVKKIRVERSDLVDGIFFTLWWG